MKSKRTALGIAIKKRLVELNMTKREFCQKIGMNECYMTHIYNGTRTGEKYLPVIEKMLGINLKRFKKSA